jgi:hypothetical protein
VAIEPTLFRCFKVLYRIKNSKESPTKRNKQTKANIEIKSGEG